MDPINYMVHEVSCDILFIEHIRNIILLAVLSLLPELKVESLFPSVLKKYLVYLLILQFHHHHGIQPEPFLLHQKKD